MAKIASLNLGRVSSIFYGSLAWTADAWRSSEIWKFCRGRNGRKRTWRNGRSRETQRPATTATSATMTELHIRGSEHASRFHAEIISKARVRCQRWLKPLRANVPFLLFL